MLDYGSLTPGAEASDAVMRDAAALGLDAAHGVSVRLTGDVPLSDQEFASLEDNIGLVGLVMLPLAVPLLIFGAGSLAEGPAALKLLAAVSLVLVAGAPFVAGAAIRAGNS